MFGTASQQALTDALMGVACGVIAMSQKGLVETSTNLASVKEPEGAVVITTSQRSSVDSAKMRHADGGVGVPSRGGRGGAFGRISCWTPIPDSALLRRTVESYRTLFGSEPKVKAIHAGLECGLFLEKYPHLEMVSFGPTMRGVHSPDERVGDSFGG